MSSIGEVAKQLGVSPHTLRYYEKIRLLSPVSKTSSGRRDYDAAQISRVEFIKRAQRMHFTLDEIRMLIELEEASEIEKPHARKIVRKKLSEVEESLQDLRKLKSELSTMLQACKASTENEDCPIITGIKQI